MAYSMVLADLLALLDIASNEELRWSGGNRLRIERL